MNAELTELEEQQKVRLEEMAFYTKLEDIYSQMDVLHAA
jgi:hypothetical protein